MATAEHGGQPVVYEWKPEPRAINNRDVWTLYVDGKVTEAQISRDRGQSGPQFLGHVGRDLITAPGGHAWPSMAEAMRSMIDWHERQAGSRAAARTDFDLSPAEVAELSKLFFLEVTGSKNHQSRHVYKMYSDHGWTVYPGRHNPSGREGYIGTTPTGELVTGANGLPFKTLGLAMHAIVSLHIIHARAEAQTADEQEANA